MALYKLCTRVGSIPVCTLRTRLENGQLKAYHGYLNEPATPEDECTKNNALAIVVAEHRYPGNPRAFETLLEDGQTLESLGIEFNSEEQQ